ncbi:MAG: hypothetical protein LBQ76_05460 [Candidatus Fibromonas sp.]|nr:hypothetical protein [Candidatus Fibromonas sp.]
MSSELETTCKNRIKRCWQWLCESNFVPAAADNVDGRQYFLDPAQLAEAVVQYCSDCEVLKIRYGELDDRIQSPRIAGLMANSINKYKPIVIREGFVKSKRIPLNELLAIFNGIFLCSEFPSKDKIWTLSNFIEDEFFSKWLNDFIHLLCYRNYTAENLILVYETFCVCYCKNALLKPK